MFMKASPFLIQEGVCKEGLIKVKVTTLRLSAADESNFR